MMAVSRDAARCIGFEAVKNIYATTLLVISTFHVA